MPPQYLQENGMISEEYIKGKRFTADNKEITYMPTSIPEGAKESDAIVDNIAHLTVLRPETEIDDDD